jgi:hypothetical protein
MRGDLKIFKIPLHPLRTTTKRTNGDRVALVVERGNACKVGDLPEDGVESIRLLSGLWRSAIGGRLGSRAGAEGDGVRLAGIHELVTHELGDDADILGGTMAVAHCVITLA